jgi:hypothetical protein
VVVASVVEATRVVVEVRANYVKPKLEMLYTYLHIILYISVKGGVFPSRHCLGGMKEREKRRKKSGTFCVKTTDE